MKDSYIKESKLRDAIKASGRVVEFGGLLRMAEAAENKLAQRECPNYYKVGSRMCEFLFGADPEDRLRGIARQMIGLLSRMYRETGISVLQKYVPAGEEIACLREIEDIVDLWCDEGEE